MGLLDAATEPQNLATAGVAVLCFATVVTLASPALRRDQLEARMKSVAARRDELRKRSRAQIAAGRSALRQEDAGLAKQIVEKLDLRRLLEDPKLADKMAQAGYRGPRPITTFYFCRLILPFLFAALAGFYLFAVNGFGLPTPTRFALTFGGLGLGYYAPSLYLSNQISKRRDSIVGAFPDALDLLLICVEAGMSIEAALQKVSGEIGTRSIELAEELALLTAELSYLPDRRLAYEGLGRRTAHPGIKAVATAMIQAEQYGTPLGNALRVMAKENRDLRIAAAEKKAAQLPAKLTVPMILFFLPVLFVVILGPAFMRVQDSQKHPQTISAQDARNSKK